MRTKQTYQDRDKWISGQTKFASPVHGDGWTYVGLTSRGEILIQKDDDFMTFADLAFDLHEFTSAFESFTRTYYISVADVARLHREESVLLDLCDREEDHTDYKVFIKVDKIEDRHPEV